MQNWHNLCKNQEKSVIMIIYASNDITEAFKCIIIRDVYSDTRPTCLPLWMDNNLKIFKNTKLHKLS